MDIKQRRQYTETILSIFLRFFILTGAIYLLGGMIRIVMEFVTMNKDFSVLGLFSQLFYPPLIAGVVAGGLFASIIGGIWLVFEYLHLKKKKVNFLNIIIALFLVPIGVCLAIPYAIYSIVKYKIPLSIEFQSARKGRTKKSKK